MTRSWLRPSLWALQHRVMALTSGYSQQSSQYVSHKSPPLLELIDGNRYSIIGYGRTGRGCHGPRLRPKAHWGTALQGDYGVLGAGLWCPWVTMVNLKVVLTCPPTQPTGHCVFLATAAAHPGVLTSHPLREECHLLLSWKRDGTPGLLCGASLQLPSAHDTRRVTQREDDSANALIPPTIPTIK